MANQMIDTEQLPRMAFYTSGLVVVSGAFTIFSSELFPYVLKSNLHSIGILLALGLVYFNMIRVSSRRYMRRLEGPSRIPWVFAFLIGGIPLFWVSIYDSGWSLVTLLIYAGIILIFSTLGALLGQKAGQKAQEQFNNLLNRFGLGTRGGGIGGGMIAAEAGSDAVVNFLLRGPEKIRVKQMSQLFNDREALGAALQDIKTEQDAREAFNALGTAFSKIARQSGRRLPYAGRFTSEQIQTEPLPEPEPRPVEPEIIEESSVRVPVPMVPAQPVAQPTTAVASAAPIMPPPAPTGRVDRARFAALFPEDRDLVQGIGSLMG